ncbi:MAG: sigma-70 family RNA polymerase sigma factor [Oscillospiraceae bacterium]|nr:sigma-70 family RNA polymerase sigma factor [Oscillospiraceae bacterium]
MSLNDTLLLIDRVKNGDSKAAETLVEENSGLIWSVARHFFGRGVDSDDLYQIGCIGFLKAIKGFDTEYGTQFSTYAVPKISGEIRRFLRDDGAIKVSRGLKEQAQKIRLARHELEQRLGREPSLKEISDAIGLCPEDIATAETATGPTQSLQYESGEEGFSLENVLGDYGQEERLVERFSLDEAIKKLPEREQMVISLRYFHGLTQDKTSKAVGVSQVQVSRLERKAIEQLRLYMKN